MTNRTKRSPWFPASQRPWEPGMYERKMAFFTGSRAGGEYVYFRHFDGKNWSPIRGPFYKNHHPWRGLAEPPKGKTP